MNRSERDLKPKFFYDKMKMVIHMKRKIIYLFAILILTLTSCCSKRTNIIVDGHYIGVDSENQSILCELFIEPISENDYIASNGKNVIKDAINNDYFSIELIINFSENDIQQIEFLNFKDAYDGASGTLIRYVDDNNCWFTPFTSQNNVVLPDMECYYSINFKIGNSKLFAYLYATEKEV